MSAESSHAGSNNIEIGEKENSDFEINYPGEDRHHGKDSLFSPNVQPLPQVPQSGSKLVDSYLHELDEIIVKRKLLLSGMQRSAGTSKSLHKRKIRRTEVSKHMDTASDAEYGRKLLTGSLNEDTDGDINNGNSNSVDQEEGVENAVSQGSPQYSPCSATADVGVAHADRVNAERAFGSQQQQQQEAAYLVDRVAKALDFSAAAASAPQERINRAQGVSNTDQPGPAGTGVEEPGPGGHIDEVKFSVGSGWPGAQPKPAPSSQQMQDPDTTVASDASDMQDDVEGEKNTNGFSGREAEELLHLLRVTEAKNEMLKEKIVDMEEQLQLCVEEHSNRHHQLTTEINRLETESAELEEELMITKEELLFVRAQLQSKSSRISELEFELLTSQRQVEDALMSQPNSLSEEHLAGQSMEPASERRSAQDREDAEALLLLSSSAEGYKEAVTDNIMLAQYLEESNVEKSKLRENVLMLEEMAFQSEARALEAEQRLAEQEARLELMQKDVTARFDQEVQTRVRAIQQKLQEKFNVAKQSLQKLQQHQSAHSREEICVIPPPPSFARGSLTGPASRVPREGYAGYLIVIVLLQIAVWALLLLLAAFYLALLERQSATTDFQLDACSNSNNIFSALFFKLFGGLVQLFSLDTSGSGSSSWTEDFCSSAQSVLGANFPGATAWMLQRHDPYRITS